MNGWLALPRRLSSRLLALVDTPLAPAPHRGEMCVEELHDAGRYVLRAELPGLDPGQISVMIADDQLRIESRRPEPHPYRRSEFHYGSLSRTVQLPWGARADTARARYRDGILEVSLAAPASPPIGRVVPIVTGPPVPTGPPVATEPLAAVEPPAGVDPPAATELVPGRARPHRSSGRRPTAAPPAPRGEPRSPSLRAPRSRTPARTPR